MTRITKADLMNQIEIHKNRYDRLLEEHTRLLAELQYLRTRARKAEEIARSQALKDLKEEYRELKKEYCMDWRIGDIRLVLTLISIFAVVLGIIYFFTK